MKSPFLAAAFGLGALLLASGQPRAQDTIKVAFIDPLSGPGATVGEVGLKTFQFIADELNAKGGAAGMKFEILPYDSKTNPQQSLVQVQKAVDAGARIITQGNGSAVAAALEDWVNKYNERNPGKEVIYLNHSAVDPALTNEKCTFSHFRFDANSDIKMEALTNLMKVRPEIKKVYLINQDYSFGQSVRATAVAMLKAKRPDIQIVGDELHPLLKVTDFSPYIAKIKASGADTVITGNWSQDFALLLKAAADTGLKTNWYTYYAGNTGGPTAVKQAGLNHSVFAIFNGVGNVDHKPSRDTEAAFRAKFGGISILFTSAFNEMRMLAAAIDKVGGVDALKIATALEDMKFEVFNGGQGYMRRDDHSFFQPMYVASFGDRNVDKEPFDEENTGWGWRIVAKIETKDTLLPTSCKMTRPG
jgi:branched-chain amino acid transport system substrate-binding protein